MAERRGRSGRGRGGGSGGTGGGAGAGGGVSLGSLTFDIQINAADAQRQLEQVGQTAQRVGQQSAQALGQINQAAAQQQVQAVPSAVAASRQAAQQQVLLATQPRPAPPQPAPAGLSQQQREAALREAAAAAPRGSQLAGAFNIAAAVTAAGATVAEIQRGLQTAGFSKAIQDAVQAALVAGAVAQRALEAPRLQPGPPALPAGRIQEDFPGGQVRVGPGVGTQRARQIEAAEAASAAGAAGAAGAPPGGRRGGGAGAAGGGFFGAVGLGGSQGILRAGLAVVGLGAGLNVAASIADRIHGALQGIVDNQFAWERSLRSTRALYADLAPQVVRLAEAQANLPDVLGTQREFLQAQTGAAFLTRRYGLSDVERTQLITASARVAFVQGIADERERQALQQRFVQFAEAGGPGLREFGVEGDPEAIARRLRLGSGAALAGLTPQQLTQARALIATEGATQFVQQARTEQATLVETQARLTHEFDVASSRLTTATEENLRQAGAPGAQTFDQRGLAESVITTMLSGSPPYRGGLQGVASERAQAEALAAQQDAQAALEQLQSELYATSGQLGDISLAISNAETAQRQATAALDKLGIAAGGATARLLGFEGSLEDIRSIARGDVARQAQAAVAARAIGPNAALNPSPTEIQAAAREQAEGQAYQGFVAPQAQRELLQGPSPTREFLTAQTRVEGPGADLEAQRARAQAALEDADRREGLITEQINAQVAAEQAHLRQQEASAQSSGVQLQLEQEQLATAAQRAQLDRAHIANAERITPLLLQQANLQDRIAVASRSNLQTENALLRARQASLEPSERLADIAFEQRRNEAEFGALVAASVRGQAIDPGRLGELALQQRELGLQAMENTPADIDAQRQIELVGRVATREDLARQATLNALDAERRALEDRLQPMLQAQRYLDAETAALDRQQQLVALSLEPLETRARQAEINARWEVLTAESLERQARARLAGLPAAGEVVAAGAAQAGGDVNANTSITVMGSVTSMDDVRRIAQEAGEAAYNSALVELTAVFNGTQANLSPRLAGTGRGPY